ncbi:MAG: hypothetical protein Q9169_006026 [Polycauliona sp. 2 TL-2023]
MQIPTSTLAYAILLPLLATAFSGDLTHFTPGPPSKPGSCGIGWTPGMDIVSLSHIYMRSSEYINGNLNPRCGTMISILNVENGEAHEAMVIDTCMGCAEHDIDVNLDLFNKIAPNGDGRVKGVEWSVIGGGATGGLTGDGSTSQTSDDYTPTTGGGAVRPGSRACGTPGETVCSEDGKMFGTCARDHTAVMMPVGGNTACRGGQIGLSKRRAREFRA